jgi:hypothetical protein
MLIIVNCCKDCWVIVVKFCSNILTKWKLTFLWIAVMSTAAVALLTLEALGVLK